METGWPAEPVEAWRPTRDTVHMWTQIVGKVRLALSPPVNHWWNVPLYVNSVGLTTSLMPYGGRDDGRGAEIEFDFVQHQLRIRTTGGASRSMTLRPRTVADFYAEFRTHLTELRIDVTINPKPVEIADPIPFTEDTIHKSYDPEAMHRFWTSLVAADRVMHRFRGEFRGKASPVHFFWGAFDLATTRFSGRRAAPHPGGVPNCPDSVMIEAYADELSSCGYWPGGGDEGAFYSYAYPEPVGFREFPVSPAGTAFYDPDLGEFILPYAAVRVADDPDTLLLDFLRSSYTAAATTANWPDRPVGDDH